MRLLLTAVALLAVAVTGGCGSGASSGGPSADGGSSPSGTPATGAGSSAQRFLSGYVESDGRVLRHDQGNDIVSEGQAYGMLIAQQAGQDAVAARIWSWTRAHLQKQDGLLAYHANEQGHILDSQAASDADTLAAYALLRAKGPGASALHAQGHALASAVLAHETFRDARGRLVLAAGPWAVQPRVVDPSYWMPSVFDDLGRMTGDPRWSRLAAESVRLVDQLTQGGRTLPPDWARVQGSRAVATGQGGGGGTPQYGADAQRLPIWFAASCDPRARRLAAAWWSVLQQDNRSAALALSPSGAILDGTPAPLALLASEASAAAAGDTSGAAQLRTGALQSNAGTPTYYGSAWVALADGLRAGTGGGCRHA